MKWHGEIVKTKLVGQTKLTEAEEVFAKLVREVASDKLFAAVVERTHTIGTSIVAQCRSLKRIY